MIHNAKWTKNSAHLIYNKKNEIKKTHIWFTILNYYIYFIICCQSFCLCMWFSSDQTFDFFKTLHFSKSYHHKRNFCSEIISCSPYFCKEDFQMNSRMLKSWWMSLLHLIHNAKLNYFLKHLISQLHEISSNEIWFTIPSKQIKCKETLFHTNKPKIKLIH